VTIFETQDRIGGLWPSKINDSAGLVHPLMVANQSRHSVQFSDLAWEDESPELPRAWQIGQYLEQYHRKYCHEATLRLGTRVVKTELQQPQNDDATSQRWKVHTRHQDGSLEDQVFDYLLVASGYFGRPVIPSIIPKAPEVPVIHSSRYRDLESLLSKTNGRGKKIIVAGGQMSGVEIAGTIASHLSTATHSPEKSVIQAPQDYSIHHIIKRPVWVFPLYTSPTVWIFLIALLMRLVG